LPPADGYLAVTVPQPKGKRDLPALVVREHAGGYPTQYETILKAVTSFPLLAITG
jgi:hypothetical protein